MKDLRYCNLSSTKQHGNFYIECDEEKIFTTFDLTGMNPYYEVTEK